MRYRLGISLLVLGVVVALSSCGGGGSDTVTTVIREQAPTTVEKTTTVTAPEPSPEPSSRSTSSQAESEPTQASPPDVVGLTLPTAKRMLKAAGFVPDPENTDTTFGIIVPENYTICEQDPPRGDVVHVLAQKYGC